jgi:O-acetyl-ADP-ribose deacetylase (regulator of RNase III)
VQRLFGPRTIDLVQGDITRQTVDAIVNAANSSLLGGSGVDGAIHRAAGPELLEECQAIRQRRGRLPAGQAVITGAGRLPARHVIHTVGPVWQGGGAREAELLASCYRESLHLAAAHDLQSIAFPSISTGAFGYPVDLAAAHALAAVHDALPDAGSVTLVRFVLFSAPDLEAYRQVLEAL